jgi:hypothetical protein
MVQNFQFNARAAPEKKRERAGVKVKGQIGASWAG